MCAFENKVGVTWAGIFGDAQEGLKIDYGAIKCGRNELICE